MLLCGLSNAGKSSILKVLDNDLESIPQLGPTIGANIKEYQPLGITTYVWDLGGQTKYRAKYLEEFAKYFEGTSVLFYVIDIQAEDFFKDSLNYLKEIVDSLARINLTSVFIPILFHKYDPHLRNKELDQKLQPLWEKVQKIVGKFMFSVYKTSMYDAHTLFQAFSEAVLHPFTEAQVFTQRIRELAQEFKSPAASMLDSYGFVYASWHEEKLNSGDVWIFSRQLQELALFIKNERGDKCKILPLTETLNYGSIYFPHKNDTIICAFLVPRNEEINKIEEHLLKTEKEFNKLLKAFDEVSFSRS